MSAAQDSNKTVRSGGCQCGQCRYQITAAPLALYVCHCRECQKQSAAAFGISVIVNSGDFHLTEGRPQHWSRPTDSGGILDCWFCPACGSRLWHGDETRDATVSVKGGSFDQPLDLGKAMHIWTTRKLPGVIIPANAVQFPGEPVE
jgi:hypothetical protein